MKVIQTSLVALALVASSGLYAQFVLPPPPNVAATAYVLYDSETDTVLLQNNGDERLPPASLTKIMTSYIAASEIALGAIKMTRAISEAAM